MKLGSSKEGAEDNLGTNVTSWFLIGFLGWWGGLETSPAARLLFSFPSSEFHVFYWFFFAWAELEVVWCTPGNGSAGEALCLREQREWEQETILFILMNELTCNNGFTEGKTNTLTTPSKTYGILCKGQKHECVFVQRFWWPGSQMTRNCCMKL